MLLEFQCSEAVPLLERLLAVLADDRGEPEWKARVYWLFALRAEAARDAGFAKLCLDRCGGYLTDANDRIILANRYGEGKTVKFILISLLQDWQRCHFPGGDQGALWPAPLP